jgi:hypothetical protein
MISDKERGSCGHDKNETGKIATKKNLKIIFIEYYIVYLFLLEKK